eukprot:s850_g2.t1
MHDAEPWKPVFDKLKSDLRKSGVQTFSNPLQDVFQMIQSLVPNKRIGAIRAGKGLERYIPGDPAWRSEFPYRQTVILHRTSHQIEDLGDENWTVLTKQQQHRKAKPSHVLLCLYFQKASVIARDVKTDQVEELDRLPVASQAAPATPVGPSDSVVPQSSVEVPTWTPLSATVSGPKFLQLNEQDKGLFESSIETWTSNSRTFGPTPDRNACQSAAGRRPVSLREFQRHSTFVQTSTQQQLQQMAQRLQHQLRERSGLFQYSDLSEIGNPAEEDGQREDVASNGQGSQPEAEPIRKVSIDLQNSADRLREAQETPVPDTPMSSFLDPESPIPTPPVEGESANEELGTDTVSAESDEPETDADMQPVYNAIIQENVLHSDILIEDQDSLWEQPDKHSAACASFAFDIRDQQFRKFLRKPSEHLDCLVAAAKKSRSEISYSELTPEEKKLFQAAKLKELNCWLDTNTVKAIMRDKIHPSRILASRWILTWKEDSNTASGRKAKARLVVKGFQDPDIGVLNSDSPTLTRDARMLLLQTISSKNWVVQSFDITTAFLRGRSDDRELAMEAPQELKDLMGMTQSQEFGFRDMASEAVLMVLGLS